MLLIPVILPLSLDLFETRLHGFERAEKLPFETQRFRFERRYYFTSQSKTLFEVLAKQHTNDTIEIQAALVSSEHEQFDIFTAWASRTWGASMSTTIEGGFLFLNILLERKRLLDTYNEKLDETGSELEAKRAFVQAMGYIWNRDDPEEDAREWPMAEAIFKEKYTLYTRRLPKPAEELAESVMAQKPHSKGGRPTNKDDDWAWERVNTLNRPRAEVKKEWTERNEKAGRHLVDPDDSFRKAVRKNRKIREKSE
jgi:hypothetical protein